MMTDFLVHKKDLKQVRFVSHATPENLTLGADEILLKIEHFTPRCGAQINYDFACWLAQPGEQHARW